MRSIVLVDDEKDLYEALTFVLQREFPSIAVRSTMGAMQAKTWLELERPTIFITDIRMPKISGLELLSLVNQRWGPVPTVIMTAFASPEVDEVLKLGTFHYLPKPFRNHELIRIIKNLLDEDLKKKEVHDTEETGFAGTISVSVLADVVQLHALAGNTGVLSVETRTQAGTIFFSKGRIVHASTSKQKARPAFNEILSWKRGRFRFQHQKVHEETIQVPTSELLLDALRALDESQKDQWEDPNAFLEGAVEEMFQEIDLTNSLTTPLPSAPKPRNTPATGLEVFSPHESTIQQKHNLTPSKSIPVHNFQESLQKLQELGGFLGASIFHSEKLTLLASLGSPKLHWMQCLTEQSKLLKNKIKLLHQLGIQSPIEDLITHSKEHFHLLRPCQRYPNIFFSVVLARSHSNLALARISLAEVDRSFIMEINI